MPRPDWELKAKDPQLRKALIYSGAFHLIVIIVAIIGLPYIKSRDMQIPPMISVELADISEVPTTNRAPVEAPKPKEEKPDPPKPSPKKPAPPKVTAPPKVETPPEDELAPPKPDKKPEPKPEKPKEKPPEKKVEKKPEPKPTEDKQTEQFDSLLKNLIDSEPQANETDPDAKKTDASPTPWPDAPLSDKLAASELDALRNQLAGCWNILAGASEGENLVVDIDVIVNEDRTVQQATVSDTSRYNSDSFFRAAADSALRALKNPRCSPLLLPPEKYNAWKSMTISFNPKDMLI